MNSLLAAMTPLPPPHRVNSLLAAMTPALDGFYAELSKFAFLSCSTFYSPDNEQADPLIIDALASVS